MDENELDELFCAWCAVHCLNCELSNNDCTCAADYEIEQLQSAITDLIERQLYPENYSDLG